MISLILKNMFLSVISISAVISPLVVVLMLCKPVIRKRYTAGWMYVVWIAFAICLALPFHIPTARKKTQNCPALNTILPEMTLPEELTMPLVLTDERTGTMDELDTDRIFPDIRTSDDMQRIRFSADTNPVQSYSGTKPAQHSAATDKAHSFRLPRIWGNEVTVLDMIAVVWFLIGMFFLLLHLAAFLYCKKQIMKEKKTASARKGQPDVLLPHLCRELDIKSKIFVTYYSGADSPMVIGFLHPVIVLPEQVYEDKELYFILKHELIHFKRHDVYLKLLFTIVNALHWFNPVIHFMCRQASVDMELSCDELVVRGSSYELRRAYTETLLSALHKQCGKNKVSAVHFTTYFYGGKKVMKERFKHILSTDNKKKGRFAAACTIAAGLALGILTGNAAPKQISQLQTAAAARELRADQEQKSSGKTSSDNGTGQKTKKNASLPVIICSAEKGIKLTSDAKAVRKVMTSFAKAYFLADKAKVRSLLTDHYTGEIELYTGNTNKVSKVVLKGFEKINSIYCYVSLEFRTGEKNKDKQCLEASLMKTGQDWRIYAYGLLSKDAKEIKRVVAAFASAYFQGNVQKTASYLSDACDQEVTVYENHADQVSILALKGLEQAAKKGKEDIRNVSIEIEYIDHAVDESFQYLSAALIKEENGWKILFYGEER